MITYFTDVSFTISYVLEVKQKKIFPYQGLYEYQILPSCIQGMRLYCFCGRFEKAYQSNIFKQLGSSSERFVGVLLIQGLPYHSSLLPISEMDCAEASNSC